MTSRILLLLLSGGNSADVYSLEGGRWSKQQSMKKWRSGHACVILADNIFAIGGAGEDSVQIFSLSSKTWREGPKLPSALYRGQAVVSNGTIFVIYKNGDVLQMERDQRGWRNVATIESVSEIRSPFPAPIISKQTIFC